MNFDQYQVAAERTATSVPVPYQREFSIMRLDLAVAALGLSGEAGEINDLIKKYLAHGHDLDRDKLAKELGDLLWYIARMCGLLGISLEHVADLNIAKLLNRYPNGFSADASINRTDKD